MKRISVWETDATPLSKTVSFLGLWRSADIAPSIVEAPVAMTIPVPPPETTSDPMKARSRWSTSVPVPSVSSAVLYTGTLSPVSEPWLTMRSFEAMILRSAGIMSPAAT